MAGRDGCACADGKVKEKQRDMAKADRKAVGAFFTSVFGIV